MTIPSKARLLLGVECWYFIASKNFTCRSRPPQQYRLILCRIFDKSHFSWYLLLRLFFLFQQQLDRFSFTDYLATPLLTLPDTRDRWRHSKSPQLLKSFLTTSILITIETSKDRLSPSLFTLLIGETRNKANQLIYICIRVMLTSGGGGASLGSAKQSVIYHHSSRVTYRSVE